MGLFCRAIATCLGIGYFGFTPGTIGSLVGLAIYSLAGGPAPVITFLLIVLGFLTAGKTERELKRRDAQEIIIDEIAGMMLALTLSFHRPSLIPYSPHNVIILFLCFRLFDVWKPFPLRHLQGLRGASGIMLDDIGAAIYSVTALYAGRYILGLVA